MEAHIVGSRSSTATISARRCTTSSTGGERGAAARLTADFARWALTLFIMMRSVLLIDRSGRFAAMSKLAREERMWMTRSMPSTGRERGQYPVKPYRTPTEEPCREHGGERVRLTMPYGVKIVVGGGQP